ncbi:MAG TPA: septum formation initiator family protein [Alphaproteobacteria bacterium]|nr:septum formation initiator family protein [Alphaproteobacteria bacterium]
MLSSLIQRVNDWWERSQRRVAIYGVGLLATLIGYHAVFGANGFVVYQQKRSELRRLQQEVQQLQEENAQREQRIKALRNDPQAIEKEARERLRYARPGEVVYTLPPAATKATSPSK